jgi:alkylation response protein AidB-like acyl-CoA dehydrogenase
VSIEKSRSLTYLAAMTLDAGRPAFREAALAKASASETALTAARTCVQVHGAIAQTWEHDAHLFVRRAWQAAASNGDARVLYREVARSCI